MEFRETPLLMGESDGGGSDRRPLIADEGTPKAGYDADHRFFGPGYHHQSWLHLILHEVNWPPFFLALFLVAYAVFGTEPDFGNWVVTNSTQVLYEFRLVKTQHVPDYVLPLFAMAVGIMVFAAEIAFNTSLPFRYRVAFGLAGFIAVWEAWLFTAGLTELGKNWVSEPRPDFLARCFGNGTAHYGPDGQVVCADGGKMPKEGRVSFPSGHSSLSISVGIFASCYMIWTVYSRDIACWFRVGRIWRSKFRRWLAQFFFIVCLLPVFGSFAIAASRVVDHMHSPADVAAGALLGLVIGGLVFARFVLEAPLSPAPHDPAMKVNRM